MDNYIKMDFMVKRSQMKGRLLVREDYKSRWFKLTAQFLYYCDGKLESGCGKVKGQIQLRDVFVVEEAESEPLGNRQYAFQVGYKAGDFNEDLHTLYVIAHRSTTRDEWIAALRQASLACGAQFARKYHPGIWSPKTSKYSCCECLNKRVPGCIPATVQLNSSDDNVSITEGAAETPTDSRVVPVTATDSRVVPIRSKKPTASNRSQSTSYVVALYDFALHDNSRVQLVKGEEYELLDDFDSATWLRVKNSKGVVGRVPASFIQLVGSDNVEQFDWFYKNVSRTQSETILENDGREGCFMVRDSSTVGVYTLSILIATADKGVVPKHYHIRKTPEGQYYLADKHSFSTIPELIYYHKLNAGGLITRLRFTPSDRVKPTLSIDADEIDPASLVIKNLLGSGNFGDVRRAIWNREVEVAVKTLKEGTMSENDFIDEATVMIKLRHNNLVKLHGVCTKKRPLMIVTEFMKNGALLTYLTRQKAILLKKPSQLLDMSVQVCSAMEYLEQNSFIHRDLAARNCLVGENLVVKVADFGMTRFVVDDEYNSSFGSKYPVKWASPEVLGYTRFSSKSDVWAFGVLMWEMFTCGMTPYTGMKNPDVVHYVCQERQHLPKPELCPESVFRIVVECWSYNADNRPSFSYLHRRLRDLVERDYA